MSRNGICSRCGGKGTWTGAERIVCPAPNCRDGRIIVRLAREATDRSVDATAFEDIQSPLGGPDTPRMDAANAGPSTLPLSGVMRVDAGRLPRRSAPRVTPESVSALGRLGGGE